MPLKQINSPNILTRRQLISKLPSQWYVQHKLKVSPEKLYCVIMILSTNIHNLVFPCLSVQGGSHMRRCSLFRVIWPRLKSIWSEIQTIVRFKNTFLQRDLERNIEVRMSTLQTKWNIGYFILSVQKTLYKHNSLKQLTIAPLKPDPTLELHKKHKNVNYLQNTTHLQNQILTNLDRCWASGQHQPRLNTIYVCIHKFRATFGTYLSQLNIINNLQSHHSVVTYKIQLHESPNW